MLFPSRMFHRCFLAVVLAVAVPAHAVANWVPLGPDGGPAAALLIDAADPQRILLSSTFAGLFESTDGAMTFAPLAGTPRTLTEFGNPNWLRTIVQSPVTPDIVLATDRNRSPGGWRSVDGGRNWTPIESFDRGGAVAFNSNESRAYVISTEGLLASDDNGATWSPLTLTGAPPDFNVNIFFTLISVSPTLPNRVYIVSLDDVIRSDDGGASWQPLEPLPGAPQVNDLAVFDDADETLFAATFLSEGQIYASADNGASWSVEASGLVDPLGNPAQIEDLAIQYSTGAIFALSEGRLHRSSGVGQPWTSTNLPAMIDFPEGIHFDGQGSNRLFLTARSGLFASTDNGMTWQARTAGFRGHSVVGLTTSRAEPGTIFADTSNSVFSTRDAGTVWTDIRPRTLLNDGAFQPISSASDPLTLHAVSGDGIPMETTDGGASWTLLTAPSAFFGLTMLIWSDPRDASTLITGDWGPASIFDAVGMFQSTDGGKTWTRRFAPPVDRVNFQPNDLADDPTRPGTVFFGIHSRSGPAFTDGLILRSTDGGATFDNLIDGFAFAEVAVDSAGTVFAGGFTLSIRQGVWRSTDGGDTWEAVNNGIPLPAGIIDIAAHPTTPGRLVVSTPTDLYETRDNGASWQVMSRSGLGRGNSTRSVEILPGTGEELELMVGTDSGVFYSDNASLRPSIPVPTLRTGALIILALLAMLLGLVAVKPLSGRPRLL